MLGQESQAPRMPKLRLLHPIEGSTSCAIEASAKSDRAAQWQHEAALVPLLIRRNR
jgi:hypothetical protein